MQHSSKSWYEKLLDPAPLAHDYSHTDASTLRSVQSLLVEPNANINQLISMQPGPLPISRPLKTRSSELAIYFSAMCVCETYTQMPIGIVLRIDGKYVGRALTWTPHRYQSFVSNMIIDDSLEAGEHLLSLEPLNNHMEFDPFSAFNVCVIEL